jgi:hypothetical protein
MLFSANLIIVNKFSLTHKYAELGKQHYVHTFHEEVIKTAWKFALVPVYTYLMFHFYHLLKRKSSFADFGQHQVFIFAIFICSAATLIPAGLVEVRYFIISWVMLSLEWQLHTTDVEVSYKKREDATPSATEGQPVDKLGLALNLAHSTLVNMLVVGIFVLYPCVPDTHEPSK